ncbi:MAG: hypothetical protein ATN33_01100 [Epulopiscium sp. Nele67-Bin001]|nr:MAG: hypothetical protein ATN33_01100 [Epulopiscium sp. Nele67-Bin001]
MVLCSLSFGGGFLTNTLLFNKKFDVEASSEVESSNPDSVIEHVEVKAEAKKDVVYIDSSFYDGLTDIHYTNTIFLDRQALQYKHTFLVGGYVGITPKFGATISYKYDVHMFSINAGLNYDAVTRKTGYDIFLTYQYEILKR